MASRVPAFGEGIKDVTKERFPPRNYHQVDAIRSLSFLIKLPTITRPGGGIKTMGNNFFVMQLPICIRYLDSRFSYLANGGKKTPPGNKKRLPT